jgi:tripartite-type tricarboxylate transporter receptor subunit TctC
MRLRTFIGFVLAIAFSSLCMAQQYPSKPIKIIVPFPVGGIADIYSRLVGNRWTELWGQPVLIENRTGAGGNIGADLVAKAAPDGYTIGIGSIGTHAVNVALFSKMPYDPVKDFAPIALLVDADGLLVVHPSVAANSVAELIALARAKPGGLTYASAGAGTASHLAGELFKSIAKVDLLHVPYKGNVPAITDLLAGQTSLIFATMPTVLPHARAGKLRALASMGEARAAATPELPAIRESLPGFIVNNWVGFFAPAGTPADIVQRLNAETRTFMSTKEMTARMTAEGARFIPMTPEQFGEFVKAEIAKWAPVVRASGAKAD